MNASVPGKTVVLGVCGSIAAYKSADLTSRLRKAGIDIHVILTESAAKFVTPLTLQTLSRNRVVTDLFDEQPGWHPGHIDLADRADLLVIAPATANCIAKLSLGLADDALGAVVLASVAPVLIAPAMNGKMWMHPATQAHVTTLRERGVEFVGPEEGLLACGYEGVGRLWNVDDLADQVIKRLLP